MPAMLTVEDLVKTYPAKRKEPAVEAVKGISFSVERGDPAAVIEAWRRQLAGLRSAS